MYAHIEYKPRTPFPHQGYEHFAEVYIEREYRLFALIGGKQYSDVVEPLYSFRGLPKDIVGLRPDMKCLVARQSPLG